MREDDTSPDGQRRPDPANNENSSAQSNSSSSLVGCRLGDFQVLRKLGRGGMADVYSARQLSLGREVAMKVLRSDFARDNDYVERFRREARAAAKLNHPNIVQVYEVGSVDSFHYIAQELIDGDNLREVLSRRGTFSAQEGIEVMIGVASALEVAADAGITHRDIKPENIMRTSRGTVKVADFGLARLGPDVEATRANLTQAGLTLGTPRYMSPEQVQGQVVDIRSDLYSLGISMYHLLAGRPPFEADDPLALAVMHLHETPAPLDRARGNDDVPEWLVAVITRLMNKLPQDRFQSPSELLDAIRGEASMSLGGYTTMGTAAATIRLQRVTDEARRVRRRRVLRLSAAILLPIVCACLTTAVISRRPVANVTTLLTPDSVAMADTVAEQFLIAATRNDEAGWLAVGTHFPPEEKSINANYYAKSMLQLSRSHLAENRLREANQVLDQLLAAPNVDRLYRALALAQQCRILEQMGGGTALTDAIQQMQSLYDELQANNPDAARRFDRVVPEKDRFSLGKRAQGDP